MWCAARRAAQLSGLSGSESSLLLAHARFAPWIMKSTSLTLERLAMLKQIRQAVLLNQQQSTRARVAEKVECLPNIIGLASTCFESAEAS